MTEGRRILFLDDDLTRSEAFMARHPEARWVQTAAECIDLLAGPWDEVHLDHDLGGERFVDHQREDCGMEVVRWLCDGPRPHLKPTLFVVHTHNPDAACVMSFHLETMGYDVVQCPFGAGPPPAGPVRPRPARLSWLDRLLLRLTGQR